MLKTFVISLENSNLRRAAVQQQLSALDLNFEFFNAIQGSDKPRDFFADYQFLQFRLNTGRKPLPGEIGCYASHVALWHRCIELGEPIVILEDDIYARPRLPEALAKLPGLIEEYGLIRLETFGRGRRACGLGPRLSAIPLGPIGRFELYYLAGMPLGTRAYAISPVAAAKLADASRALTAPVDKFLQRTWEHKVPMYALGPAPVVSARRPIGSTIGGRQTKNWNPVWRFLRFGQKGAAGVRRFWFNRTQLGRLGITNEGFENERLAARRAAIRGPLRPIPMKTGPSAIENNASSGSA